MGKNITKAEIFQARIYDATRSAISAARVAVEEIRSGGRARTVCEVLALALAFLTLWTLVTFRIAQRDAQRDFEEWKVRFADEYISQQEAKAMGYPPDPREQFREQTITTIAQAMEGLRLYNYGLDDYKTFLVGVDNRRRNPIYPDTLIEVIQQKGQFPGFSENNEVTAKTYDTAEKLLAWLEAQERPLCSSDFVYASFEREGVVLRDTWEITTKTHFWRLEE